MNAVACSCFAVQLGRSSRVSTLNAKSDSEAESMVLLEEEEVSSLQADKLNVATAIRKSKNEKFDGFMILLFGERFYST